ncbi:zinc finger protein 830 [Microplitis demolitor]|uniref:zinc finger protein 830 n=1 Tax=Microplitis demolitor TaxID=69319 RepID=UPI0004CCE934|nr:zinc finger protein 830 [Microplitis demolitor]
MSKSKKLCQHDLRKAMNDHKKKLGAVKKIESPLAKYTESGQLMCVICKSVVRNETVWVVHLNSKTHKENVALAKKALEVKETPKKVDINSFKRPPSPTRSEGPNKKVKGILKNSIPVKTTPALPADFFDSPGNGTAAAEIKNSEKAAVNISNDQPAESASVEAEQVQEAESSNSAALPEGFFDDPVLDAKVRNVEYKDPVEEEWDRYLKEIKEETAQSAQIIAEDHEEATTERQINEIDEQLNNLARVINLMKCKEQINVPQKKVEEVEEMSSDEDSDFDEFLDWRAKKSYK